MNTPPDKPKRTSKIILGIVLGVLTLPAAFIAFFVTCLVTLPLQSEAPLYLGGLAAVVTIAAMVYGIYRLSLR